MNIFNRKPQAAQLDVVDESGIKRDYAIDYIVSLDRSAKDRFIESIELIWQGYDKLYRVQTRDEKAAIKAADEAGIEIADDPDMVAIFEETDDKRAKAAKSIRSKGAKS